MKKNPKVLCLGLQKKIVFPSATAFRIAFTSGFLGEFDFLYCLYRIWPIPLGFDKSVVITDGGGQRGLSADLLIDPSVVNWPALTEARTPPRGVQASECRDVKEKHLAVTKQVPPSVQSRSFRHTWLMWALTLPVIRSNYGLLTYLWGTPSALEFLSRAFSPQPDALSYHLISPSFPSA